MKIDEKEISAIFKTEARATKLPVGLRIDLQQPTDLYNLLDVEKDVVQEQGQVSIDMYHNPELLALAAQWKLVIVGNAFIGRQPQAAFSLSGDKSRTRQLLSHLESQPDEVDEITLQRLRTDLTENLEQDPWHCDIFDQQPNKPNATIIYNPDNVNRNAPTIWAPQQDVRTAYLQVAKKLTGTFVWKKDRPLADLLQYMAQGPLDLFTFKGDKKTRMQLIHTNLKGNVTGQVAAVIPADRKYAQTYAAGKREVSIHYNDGELFHARPACDDADNEMDALTLSP